MEFATLDFVLLINDLALAAESVDYSVNTFFGISLGDQIVLTLGIYLQYCSNTFSTLHTDSLGIEFDPDKKYSEDCVQLP